MNTLEQIKHDYEQTHYRKQRELINKGRLNYWKLPKSNKEGIVAQCKEEAEKYPELEWERYLEYEDKRNTLAGKYLKFNSVFLYYRRIDPLPTEDEVEEVAELRRINKANEATIEELWDKLAGQFANSDASVDQLSQITALQKEIEKLQETIENKDIIIEDYQVSEASLYRDIRTLAMRQL